FWWLCSFFATQNVLRRAETKWAAGGSPAGAPPDLPQQCYQGSNQQRRRCPAGSRSQASRTAPSRSNHTTAPPGSPLHCFGSQPRNPAGTSWVGHSKGSGGPPSIPPPSGCRIPGLTRSQFPPLIGERRGRTPTPATGAAATTTASTTTNRFLLTA